MSYLDHQHILTLQAQAKKRPGIATFIGAGCSKVLLIPLWKQMLIDMNKEFKHYASDAEVSDDIEKSGFPQVASNIKLAASSEQAYKDLLKKFISPRACHFTSLHLELVQLSKLILTTNYDQSFEEALDAVGRFQPTTDCRYTRSSLGKFNTHGWGYERHIFHLHGDIATGDVVLTSESYIEQYENAHSGVATLINSIFAGYSTLFVGFSFDDEVFVGFLKNALEGIRKDRALFNETTPRHYCIMSDFLTKDYLTAEELLASQAKISVLLSNNVIAEDEDKKTGEKIFRFTSETKSKLQTGFLPINVNQYLIEQVKTFEVSQEKLKMMQDLGIDLITFERDNYLQIEYILRKMNEIPVLSAPKYIPN